MLNMPVFLPLEQGLANCGLLAKSGWLPVSINKVLLAYSHTHSFTYHLWLLSCCTGRGEQFIEII